MKKTLSNVSKAYLKAYEDILGNMICGMNSARLSCSISRNFIIQMLPHHRAAIEMCENLLRYTTNIELQNICCDIIREQTQSIADMKRVLNSCGRCRNCGEELRDYQCKINEIKNNMFSCMRNAPACNRINISFLREMIPHHKGAVEMCKATLRYRICDGLEPILKSIIASQEQGIRQMEKLLEELENCCEG